MTIQLWSFAAPERFKGGWVQPVEFTTTNSSYFFVAIAINWWHNVTCRFWKDFDRSLLLGKRQKQAEPPSHAYLLLNELLATNLYLMVNPLLCSLSMMPWTKSSSSRTRVDAFAFTPILQTLQFASVFTQLLDARCQSTIHRIQEKRLDTKDHLESRSKQNMNKHFNKVYIWWFYPQDSFQLSPSNPFYNLRHFPRAFVSHLHNQHESRRLKRCIFSFENGSKRHEVTLISRPRPSVDLICWFGHRRRTTRHAVDRCGKFDVSRPSCRKRWDPNQTDLMWILDEVLQSTDIWWYDDTWYIICFNMFYILLYLLLLMYVWWIWCTVDWFAFYSEEESFRMEVSLTKFWVLWVLAGDFMSPSRCGWSFWSVS